MYVYVTKLCVGGGRGQCTCRYCNTFNKHCPQKKGSGRGTTRRTRGEPGCRCPVYRLYKQTSRNRAIAKGACTGYTWLRARLQQGISEGVSCDALSTCALIEVEQIPLFVLSRPSVSQPLNKRVAELSVAIVDIVFGRGGRDVTIGRERIVVLGRFEFCVTTLVQPFLPL